MADIKLQSRAKIPTIYGVFEVMAYAKSEGELMPHVTLMTPYLNVDEPVLLRIHSECMTGDVFASQKCDCGDQLDFSLKEINNQSGIVIYLRQEGRGIGLIEKLKAYELQNQGYDTVDANIKLGHQADSRDYMDAINILKDLGISKVRLMTNNPEKLDFLDANGIQVLERIPIVLPINKHSEEYLETKKTRMGHIL